MDPVIYKNKFVVILLMTVCFKRRPAAIGTTLRSDVQSDNEC